MKRLLEKIRECVVWTRKRSRIWGKRKVRVADPTVTEDGVLHWRVNKIISPMCFHLYLGPLFHVDGGQLFVSFL